MKEKKIGAAMWKGYPQVTASAQELPLSPVMGNRETSDNSMGLSRCGHTKSCSQKVVGPAA